MPSIAFLDVEPQDQPRLREKFPDARFSENGLNGKELIDLCGDCEIVSTFITSSFSREIIEQLPSLRLLCTRSVGYDHIDLAACNERGIAVTHVPDYGSHVIAEHVFALLLSTLRFIPEGRERTREGNFDYRGLKGMALKGKTIGIVGTGRIGRHVARIAHGFEMKILAFDQYQVPGLEQEFGLRYVALDELLQSSDIITLHVPSLPETHHLIDAEALTRMKHGVVLVNTARGAVIDSTALHRALEDEIVSFALLDVLEHEREPEKEKALLTHPRVVVTPHAAFYTDESVRRLEDDCLQSIAEWMAGKKPAHCVLA